MSNKNIAGRKISITANAFAIVFAAATFCICGCARPDVMLQKNGSSYSVIIHGRTLSVDQDNGWDDVAKYFADIKRSEYISLRVDDEINYQIASKIIHSLVLSGHHKIMFLSSKDKFTPIFPKHCDGQLVIDEPIGIYLSPIACRKYTIDELGYTPSERTLRSCAIKIKERYGAWMPTRITIHADTEWSDIIAAGQILQLAGLKNIALSFPVSSTPDAKKEVLETDDVVFERYRDLRAPEGMPYPSYRGGRISDGKSADALIDDYKTTTQPR